MVLSFSFMLELASKSSLLFCFCDHLFIFWQNACVYTRDIEEKEKELWSSEDKREAEALETCVCV